MVMVVLMILHPLQMPSLFNPCYKKGKKNGGACASKLQRIGDVLNNAMYV